MKSTMFARDFLTGLLAIAGMIGLVLMLWKFGELRNFEKRYEFDIALDRAAGLAPNSTVSFMGVKVGNVESAVVRGAPSRDVLVRVKVRESIRIPENFTVFVERAFTGESALELDIPENDPGTAPAVAAGSEHRREVTTLFDSLIEPVSRIGDAADEFERLARTYADLGADVKDVLAPRTLAEVEAGAPPNLLSTMARIDQAALDVSATLGDARLRDDIRSLADRAAQVLDSAQELAESWTKTANSAEGAITATSDRVAAAAADAQESLRQVSDAAGEIKAAASRINRGEGTAGQLITNPDLYNSLKSAADRLDRTLNELQLLIEKYRNEGIPLKL